MKNRGLFINGGFVKLLFICILVLMIFNIEVLSEEVNLGGLILNKLKYRGDIIITEDDYIEILGTYKLTYHIDMEYPAEEIVKYYEKLMDDSGFIKFDDKGILFRWDSSSYIPSKSDTHFKITCQYLGKWTKWVGDRRYKVNIFLVYDKLEKINKYPKCCNDETECSGERDLVVGIYLEKNNLDLESIPQSKLCPKNYNFFETDFNKYMYYRKRGMHNEAIHYLLVGFECHKDKKKIMEIYCNYIKYLGLSNYGYFKEDCSGE